MHAYVTNITTLANNTFHIEMLTFHTMTEEVSSATNIQTIYITRALRALKEYLSRLYKSVILAGTASQHESKCSNLLLHLPFHDILGMLSHRIFSGYAADNSTDVLKYEAVVSPATKARKRNQSSSCTIGFQPLSSFGGVAFPLCLS